MLPVAQPAYAMVLLIGLAVGVDYSIFYLKRERQERAAGRSERAALEVAAATSGRSVLVSGLTVIVAMAGMFLTGDETFASLGVATILVVAVAVLGSLTVLPALLSRLGDNVDRLRVPLVSRLRRDDGDGRIWGAIVDRVLRRPRLSAAARRRRCCSRSPRPRCELRIATPGPDTVPAVARRRPDLRPDAGGVPRHGPARHRRRQGAERERARGAGRRSTSSSSGRSRAAARSSRSRSRSTRTPPSRASPSRSPASGTDAASIAVARRRCARRSCPRPSARSPAREAGVTGLTAAWTDQADELKSNLPPVVAFVLLLRVRA